MDHPDHAFHFTLEVFGADELDESLVDSLYEAGCDDGTICSREARIYISFTREAATLQEAIESAIRDVCKAGFDAVLVDR